MSERAIHLATLAMSPNPMNLFRNKIKIILLYFIIHQIVLEGEGGAAEGHLAQEEGSRKEEESHFAAYLKGRGRWVGQGAPSQNIL